MENLSVAPDPCNGYCCGICSQRFHHPSLIYGCDYGHFFCLNCYKQEYCEGKDSVCPHRHCQSQIYRMDRQAVRQGSETFLKGRKMFPDPENIAKGVIKDSMSNKSLSSLFRCEDTNNILALSSKKPVNCPYPGCKKTIAVTAVDSHFKYEHKYVASITTQFEIRNGLEFNPYDVKPNQRVCIVLINVLGDRDNVTKVVSCKSLNNMTVAKPVMLVMATRIPDYRLNDKDEDLNDDDDCPDDLESYAYYHMDKILLWVASNVPTRCRYTLAISTPCKAIRLKYYGAISQIDDDCIKLCEEGRGLILNQPHTVGMTNNGKKPLTLDVVLHKEDSFERETSH